MRSDKKNTQFWIFLRIELLARIISFTFLKFFCNFSIFNFKAIKYSGLKFFIALKLLTRNFEIKPIQAEKINTTS